MLYAHRKVYVVICLRLVAIGYECAVAMTMIMLDNLCVQSFMTTHMTNNNL